MNTLFQQVRNELKALGLDLQQFPGHYLVNFLHGTEATGYTTDDLHDALNHGREMAKPPPPLPPDPPLGPMRCNPFAKRRAVMYSHNAKIAKRRASRIQKRKSE
jgi:hypothetical protein